MTFAPVFQRPISATFDRRAAAAAVSWWLAGGAPTPVAVYQPIGAASLAASYVNLANPGTYDCTTTAAPSWDATNGWIWPSGAWHLVTGLVPAATTWSYLVRYSNGPSSGSVFATVLSSYNGNSQCAWIAPRNAAGNRRFGNCGILDTASGSSTAGVIGAAGGDAYHDGSDIGNIPAGSVPNVQLTIGTLNAGGTIQTSITYVWKGNIQAVGIYNTTLTAPQVAAVSAAMAAL